MKKAWLVCLLAALLVWIPMALAEGAAEAPVEATAEVTAEATPEPTPIPTPTPNPLADAAVRSDTAANAFDLMCLFAGLDYGEAEMFYGEPDNDLVWNVLSNYCIYIQSRDDGPIDVATLTEAYRALFAYGDMANYLAQPGGMFDKEGDAYTFAGIEGDVAEELTINETDEYVDDELSVDVTAFDHYSIGSQAFLHNATIHLLADENAPFGARVSGYVVNRADKPVFASAEATDVLADQDGFNYRAVNVLDGDLATCWSYDSEVAASATVILTAEAPQKVRGLALTPGYAKSEKVYTNNCRLREVSVVVDGGEPMHFAFGELDAESCFDGFVVLPFSDVYEAKSIEVTVIDVYPGAKFQDVCISEIQVF